MEHQGVEEVDSILVGKDGRQVALGITPRNIGGKHKLLTFCIMLAFRDSTSQRRVGQLHAKPHSHIILYPVDV